MAPTNGTNGNTPDLNRGSATSSTDHSSGKGLAAPDKVHFKDLRECILWNAGNVIIRPAAHAQPWSQSSVATCF